MVPDAHERITVTVTAPALVANRGGIRARSPERSSTSRAATRAYALARRRSNLRRRRAWEALQVLQRLSDPHLQALRGVPDGPEWAHWPGHAGTEARTPVAPPTLPS